MWPLAGKGGAEAVKGNRLSGATLSAPVLLLAAGLAPERYYLLGQLLGRQHGPCCGLHRIAHRGDLQAGINRCAGVVLVPQGAADNGNAGALICHDATTRTAQVVQSQVVQPRPLE